jgi:predicted DCC family thiol-disulfide oxidoreductase YuxK
MIELTLFYDGTCPLCAREMRSLEKHDKRRQIKSVDINSEEFMRYPNVNYEKANEILHAYDSQGQLLLGLDAAHKAWSLLGRGWLYAPLRWPIIKPAADKAYVLFARHRYRISKWVTGAEKCNCGR